MISLAHYLTLGAILFCLSVVGQELPVTLLLSRDVTHVGFGRKVSAVVKMDQHSRRLIVGLGINLSH